MLKKPSFALKDNQSNGFSSNFLPAYLLHILHQLSVLTRSFLVG